MGSNPAAVCYSKLFSSQTLIFWKVPVALLICLLFELLVGGYDVLEVVCLPILAAAVLGTMALLIEGGS